MSDHARRTSDGKVVLDIVEIVESVEFPVKQVIVIRKDLNMCKGKFIAQAAHGVAMSVYDKASFTANLDDTCDAVMVVPVSLDFLQWLKTGTKKITVSVDSEVELLELLDAAEMADIPVQLVTDSGLTEFGGVPTNTCIVIGPAKNSSIDPITMHLPLL